MCYMDLWVSSLNVPPQSQARDWGGTFNELTHKSNFLWELIKYHVRPEYSVLYIISIVYLLSVYLAGLPQQAKHTLMKMQLQ